MRYRPLVVLLTLFACLTAIPAAAQLADLTYSTEADDVLLEARQISSWHREGNLESAATYRIWRLFGDGWLRTWSTTEPFQRDAAEPQGHDVRLKPEVIEQLLQSIDQQAHLGAQEANLQPPLHGEYLTVALRRYESADAQSNIDYFDVTLTDDLEMLFRELYAVDSWAAHEQDVPRWASGNGFPRICEIDVRCSLRLTAEEWLLEPIWCTGLREVGGFSTFRGSGPFDVDQRERVRERLRERLRALPRGLQDGG